mgnify:CR=1 FL=1
MKPKTRTERLDMETVGAIRRLCADYGLRLSGYYDVSGLNDPGEGRLAYMAFLAAMSGGEVTPETEARVARSLAVARQALRRAGRLPVMREVLANLRAVAEAYEESPEVFAAGELTTLRRVAARAAKRAAKKR